MLVVSCWDLLLEEIFHFQLSPFLDIEFPDTYKELVEELVHEVYDRYVDSQGNLPLEEQRMPEEGKS